MEAREAAAAAQAIHLGGGSEPDIVTAEQSRVLRKDTAIAQDCYRRKSTVVSDCTIHRDFQSFLINMDQREAVKKSEFSFRIPLSFVFSLEFEFKIFPIISFY